MNGEYYKVRNRETLRTHASGMEITRATKHEPIDFMALSKKELERMTDSVNGSKFLSSWPLPRVVEWLAAQIEAYGWQFPPGAQATIHLQIPEEVGYVRGKKVNTITIKVSGRWVHAYPDEDRP